MRVLRNITELKNRFSFWSDILLAFLDKGLNDETPFKITDVSNVKTLEVKSKSASVIKKHTCNI